MSLEFGNTSDEKFGYAKILVFGESGSGKTYFASTYDNKKTLLINIKAESGTMTLRALGASIKTVTVNSYADMKEAIEWIKKNGAEFELIFIDSLSQWQKNLEKEIPESGNKYAKWTVIANYTKEIVDAFKALPFHVVFTCEIKKEKDEDTGEIFYQPSLMGKSKDDISYWFDEVYYFARIQTKLSDPITYKALTAAAMKYPCKSRLAASGEIPVSMDNPKLNEILSKSIFKKIDKKEHVAELKTVAEVVKPISETNLTLLRDLLSRKDVDQVAFLKYYKAPHLPGFPDNMVADAISKLNKCQDKPAKTTAVKPGFLETTPKPEASRPSLKSTVRKQARKTTADVRGANPIAGNSGYSDQIEGAH